MDISLPDGSIKSFDGPVSALEVAQSIGAGLAKAAIGARVDGELIDVTRKIDHDAKLEILTKPRKGTAIDEQDAGALYLLRHSAAHVMAEAIQRIWPQAQLAYGPPLDNGFYYDIKLDAPISSDDFELIEAKMAEIVAEDRPFTRYELALDIGFDKLGREENPYKKDNAERAQQGGANSFSWYITGKPRVFVGKNSGEEYVQIISNDIERVVRRQDFEQGLINKEHLISVLEGMETDTRSMPWEDLCMGPHVPSTGVIGAFKVTSIAQSHWHGDVESDKFQRVYGTAFFSAADLEEHLRRLDEARQRDHRVIGQKLGLFAIDDKVGQGLILWKPAGAVVRQELQNFIMHHLQRQGYKQVFTPHIGKLDLYKTSGHFPYYQDSQFPPLIDQDQIKQLADDGCTCAELSNLMQKGEIEGYLLKPMNCPHHIRIYASDKHSYRDLPIRLAEFGTVYRWEQSGELGGMTRVRGFTQDDAHLFCTEDQLEAEVLGCLDLVKIIFKTLGMSDYRVRVGKRDPDSSKYVGDPKNWDKAEAACKAAAASLGVPFSEEPGEAAFYGPKIDFVVKDVIGREWQLGTVQVDYNLPQRFDLSYIGADNTEHRPVMIHRAPFGSMERFIGVLIEHFAGAFPLWLSPEQVRVLPISDKFLDYAKKVSDTVSATGLRVTLDDSNDRVNAKIKIAQDAKVPYMLVVGGRDAEAGTVSVRERSKGDLGALALDDFVAQAKAEADSRGEQVVTV